MVLRSGRMLSPPSLHNYVIKILSQNVLSVRDITGMQLFNVALCNRADHTYFHAVFCSFFPRLISAAADWMSAILPHMVWP